MNVADIILSLNRILEHPTFKSSQQLSAFLSYVVNEELSGRGEFIKAYSVAVDALGRPESFDAGKDPVIRVIASRLRKALTGFYEDVPAGVPVEIMLIKGSYRPVFAPISACPGDQPPDPSDMAETPRSARDEHAGRDLHHTARQLKRQRMITLLLIFVLIAAGAYVAWDVGGYLTGADNLSILDSDQE